MKKLYAELSVVGMGIGFPVTIACMTLIGGWNQVVAELLVWMVASALYGILSGFVFYKKNDLPLPAAMGLHCLGCMGITVAAVMICGYADSFLTLLVAVLPVFLVIYALVYAFIYFLMRKDAEQINRALEKE